jgi:hypothetical protein
MQVRLWSLIATAFGHHVDPVRMSRRGALTGAALLVAGFLIALFRYPPSSWGILWTEDGGVFLEQAYRAPLAQTVWVGYAGYAHLVPRLVAAATAEWVPLDQVPLATSIIMAVATSLLGAAIFYLARAQLRTFPARMLLWLLIVAAPIGGLEVALSTANFQWYLLVGAFYAVMLRRSGLLAAVVAPLILFAAIGSSAVALGFLPLAVLRLVRFRGRTDVALLAAGLVASLFQGWVILHSVRPGVAPHAAIDFVQSFLVDVMGTAWFGPRPTVVLDYFAPAAFLVLAGLAACITVAVSWLIRRQSSLGLVSLAVALGFFIVVGVVTGFVGRDTLFWLYVGIGSRYFVLPVALIGGAIVAGVEQGRASQLRWIRIVAAAVAVLQLLIVVIEYRGHDPRATVLPPGPSWSQEVAAARSDCARDPAEPVYLRGTPSLRDSETIVISCGIIRSR